MQQKRPAFFDTDLVDQQMDLNNIPTAQYGALLQVRDLPRVKSFYRDVIRLGAPVVDSNFWVEFQLPGNGVLALSQSNAARPQADKNDVSWMLRVEDLAEMVSMLNNINIQPIRPAMTVPGKECATFSDPEGNLFTLYATIQSD